MCPNLKKLLEERDAREKEPFENLIYTINEYCSELESALILVDSLKTQLKRSRLFQRENSISKSGSGSEIGNSALEIKFKELKEERAELYRQQGIQATHLLTLNDQLRSKDLLISSLNGEISALKQAQERRDEEVKKLREKVREGEEGAKIIGDELVALQLELLRLDQWQEQQQKKKSADGDVSQLPNKLIEEQESTNIISLVPDNSSNPIINIPDPNENKLKLIKEKEIVAPHQYPISSYTSKPSSRQLLTGSEDQKIILYDLTRISTKMVLKWSKMNGPIVSLAVDSEGRSVASCSAYDKEVTIWTLSTGKIQGTLQFTDDSSGEVPLLHFGTDSRLWMSLGRCVRLWDVQRGLLLRSWNRDMIPSNIQSIVMDQKRPDRLWCFDDRAHFTILNAVTGKLEVPWKPIFEGQQACSTIHYDCSKERILVARFVEEDNDWIITGFSRTSSGLEGAFEFSLKSDLIKSDKNNEVHAVELKSISIHADRPDLLALILKDSIVFVKVSLDHWKPEILSINCADCDSLHWGPTEDDPINGEKGCKVVLIAKESKQIKLYTLARI